MDSYLLTSPVLGEDQSVMARMQKKFWKTKQVLIKATGKKEDEHVVASDADLDAKLEFFRSVQITCTELLKVIEKYQQRITRLSQEENELGLFLRFQAEHDKTKAGSIMDATSRAGCSSAKQRLALCAPLQRMEQEVATFRRRAIADTLLTVGRMEKARTEYRGALLWMKDVSQELDPDTYKQLEKFRKVQAQVRGTKVQFDKLKNDVCQKVDMLGASRCNMLSHSLCTYQTTLLQFWEKTATNMSGIHEAFKGYVPYHFTTLKELRDPLEHLSDLQITEDQDKETQNNTDSLVSLEEEMVGKSALDSASVDGGQNKDFNDSSSPSLGSGMFELVGPFSSLSPDDDPLLIAPALTPIPTMTPSVPALQPQSTSQAMMPVGLQWDCSVSSGQNLHLSEKAGQDLLSDLLPRSGEEKEKDDLYFLLSPGATSEADDFNKAWQDAFGYFEQPAATPSSSNTPSAGSMAGPSYSFSQPSTPTSFLPSQLLDHGLSTTDWMTPPMFQAPSTQLPPSAGQVPAAQNSRKLLDNVAPKGGTRDMSAWFDLFADLDPLANPDAIGRTDEELLNA